MLNVILKILSLIGILLLILLGVLLVTLLFILFFPVCYRLKGCRDAEKTTLSIRAAWLFGLLRVSYDYPDPGKLTVRILWHKLSGRPKKDDSDVPQDAEAPKQDSGESCTQQGSGSGSAARESSEGSGLQGSNSGTAKTDDAAPRQKSSAENAVQESAVSPTQADTADGSSQEDASSEEKNTGIRYTIRHFYDKIRKTWEKIKDYTELLREDETKQLFSHIAFRLKKLLRHIRPRRLKAELLYGTGSPDTTGYLFGLYGVLSPSLGKRVSVTPDFERTVFEGTVDAAGHITAAVLLVNACSVLLDRKLRKFIKKVKRTGRN